MTKNAKLPRRKNLIFVLAVALAPCVCFAQSSKVQNLNVTSLQLAADNGDDQAQYSLGSIYCLGMQSTNGGPEIQPNIPRCLDLLTKSSLQGNVDAQATLGSIYNAGIYVPKDYAQAYYWLSIASLQNPTYEGARDEIEKKLPPDVMMNVQDQVRHCRPPPLKPSMH